VSPTAAFAGAVAFGFLPVVTSLAADSPPAVAYVSAARPNGVVGGAAARALSAAIADALRARSDVAEPDGALADAAAWFVAADGDSRKRGAGIAARRSGFVGEVLTAAVFPIGEPEHWRRALAALARNFPVTRYGVYVPPDGRVAGVVFGNVELKLEPFPRHVHAGATLRLRGEVNRRFDRASVHVTGADGRSHQTPFPGRQIETDVRVAKPGTYRVEVMGDGAMGPTVLANVPVYVDAAEPELEASLPSAAAPRSAQDAQSRMLVLLNEGRRAAGVAPLVSDAELAAIALAHTRDMAGAHFFGHQSPTTGRIEDRVRRAGVAVIKLGENISQGDSVEAAYAALMASPSHRANMLEPAFTHVGLGIVLRSAEHPALLATLVFARRPRARAQAVTSAAVSDFISSLRRARGDDPLRIDPVLQQAAEAGMDVVRGSETGVVAAAALEAAQTALAREARRLHQSRPAVCTQLIKVLELEELGDDRMVTDAHLGRIGVAAAERKAGAAAEIFVLVVVEAAACK
jgi:uncharacterized protein YkwD